MKKLVVRFVHGPPSAAVRDIALLIFRVWVGLPLLLLHGMEKWHNRATMAGGFPDPLHMGPSFSLYLAMFAEVVCSALLVLGLASRPALIILVGFMTVIFFSIHGGTLSGAGSGELPYMYLGAFILLLFCGPGRISFDYLIFRRNQSRR